MAQLRNFRIVAADQCVAARTCNRQKSLQKWLTLLKHVDFFGRKNFTGAFFKLKWFISFLESRQERLLNITNMVKMNQKCRFYRTIPRFLEISGNYGKFMTFSKWELFYIFKKSTFTLKKVSYIKYHENV